MDCGRRNCLKWKQSRNSGRWPGIASKLNAAGIVWDVGASLLLYLHGITDEFHDIDLMVRQEDADDAARNPGSAWNHAQFRKRRIRSIIRNASWSM